MSLDRLDAMAGRDARVCDGGDLMVVCISSLFFGKTTPCIRANPRAALLSDLFGHFFIVSSIVADGVGIESAIKEIGNAHLHLPTLLLIGGGTTACLRAITVVGFVSGVCRLIIFRIAAIAIALC